MIGTAINRTCVDKSIEEKANAVKEAFPNINIVIGDLDNSTILVEEAAKADVVIRT